MSLIRSVLHMLWMVVTVIPYTLAVLLTKWVSGSSSKTYRVAGFRSGWMVITGPQDHAKGFIEGITLLASTRLCPNVPAQHALQAALGLAAILRMRGAGQQRQHAHQGSGARKPHQVGSNRLWPLMSTGCGRPSRSSRVGATSRSAPPPRSATSRLPT